MRRLEKKCTRCVCNEAFARKKNGTRMARICTYQIQKRKKRVHLQRHEDNKGHQDTEERATEDTLVLAGGTTVLGSGALAEA